jgi:hypothetical protein
LGEFMNYYSDDATARYTLLSRFGLYFCRSITGKQRDVDFASIPVGVNYDWI